MITLHIQKDAEILLFYAWMRGLEDMKGSRLIVDSKISGYQLVLLPDPELVSLKYK